MSEEKRRSIWFWLLLGGGIFTAFVVVVAVLGYVAVRSMSNDSAGFSGMGGNGNIAVIDVSGVILNADTIIDQLQKFDEDSTVKAIILHIDSPGGAAAPSQEIYHEVVRIRNEKRKPIIASIESLGASGAYYIASGTDKIYANDASLVGSIGVIMEWTNYGDLLKWAKLKPEVIHAGALKDAGDPSRDITPQEQAYFQDLVNNMYGQFVSDVANGRHQTVDQIKTLATGQVWTGQEAISLHLIDKEGGFRIALLDTARSVGIRGEPNIVRPTVRHRSLLDILTTNADDLFPNPGQLLEKNPGFYFLWR
jgi:protease IV